ncbi:hypothetical protein WJX73_010693 [Symbiochloris irregularis]|uniref:Bidirectional sugar transporter SWEET n=1 Tax=Symbiochloris irregularis TaxID=706552 RepID=A0AAW1PKY3_9CHLO
MSFTGKVDIHDLLLTKVAPGAGVVIATLLFGSPLFGVLQMRKDGVLGSTNPLPFPLIFGNCCAWVAYAYVKHDIFVFLANDFGIIFGLFFTLSAYGVSNPATRNFLAVISLGLAFVISGAGAVTVFGGLDPDQKPQLWGLLANLILLIFYAAPLSTVAEVFRTRSSASLYWPLSLMNVINGALWVTYGYATKDYLILTPNAAGFVLGLGQLMLCLTFPRDSRAKRESRSEDIEQPLINE